MFGFDSLACIYSLKTGCEKKHLLPESLHLGSSVMSIVVCNIREDRLFIVRSLLIEILLNCFALGSCFVVDSNVVERHSMFAHVVR